MKQLILIILLLLSGGCKKRIPIPDPTEVTAANVDAFLRQSEGMLDGCASITRVEGVQVDCFAIWQEWSSGRQRYAERVDTAALGVKMGEVYWFADAPSGIDARGVPVLASGPQAYFWSIGPIIIWANPFAVHCEVLHFLHWRLHRDAFRAPDAQGEPSATKVYEIIGHGTSDDPLAYECWKEAVEDYLAATH